MVKQDSLSQALCSKCASIYTLPRVAEYRCPFCHHHADKVLYEKIFNYAKKAVYYGYSYRKAYEEQILKDGRIAKRYFSPEPAAILCFIGIAALSGIIGGASYDLVKKIISKIMGSSNSRAEGIDEAKIKICNNRDIKVFIQYIQEFHEGKSTAIPEIKWEVKKERIIKKLEHTLFPKFNKGAKLSRKTIHEALRTAFEKDQDDDKPEPSDFEAFWSDVDE